MGLIVDRSREHLGPADRAVIQARRLLLEAVRTVGDGGVPRGVAPSYATLAAAEAVLPHDADWREMALPAGSQIEQTV
jgi:phthalate 4,5-dioxygenase oxygenase subunit